MKKCPFCAEEIQDEAVKCRFCNEFLEGSKPPKTKWYFSTTVVVLAVLSLGPLALPLIWFHPKYKIITKTILTIAVVGLTIWLYLISEDIYKNFMRQWNQMIGIIQNMGS